jgi:hypothetical protein
LIAAIAARGKLAAMKRGLLAVAGAALYVLHQDFWFWREARPLAFGFLPVGLFYHAVYTVAVSALLWAMVKWAWPSHLERGISPGEDTRP